MDLKGFLKENNGFPENRRVHISPCFRENGEEVLWELRAVSEEEYRRAAEGKRDKWAYAVSAESIAGIIRLIYTLRNHFFACSFQTLLRLWNPLISFTASNNRIYSPG